MWFARFVLREKTAEITFKAKKSQHKKGGEGREADDCDVAERQGGGEGRPGSRWWCFIGSLESHRFNSRHACSGLLARVGTATLAPCGRFDPPRPRSGRLHFKFVRSGSLESSRRTGKEALCCIDVAHVERNDRELGYLKSRNCTVRSNVYINAVENFFLTVEYSSRNNFRVKRYRGVDADVPSTYAIVP